MSWSSEHNKIRIAHALDQFDCTGFSDYNKKVTMRKNGQFDGKVMISWKLAL